MLKKVTITLLFLFVLVSLGQNTYAEDRVTFTDLNKGYWAEKQVYELTSLKVINGFPDHTFRPEEKVTRAQFAAMVSRALKLADADSNFKDVPKSSALYKEVSQAAAAGIVVGDGVGFFHPDRHVSRAEMAIMIDRALQLKGSFTVSAELSYEDSNEIGISSRESVKRMTNYHVMEAFEENKFLPNEKGTRVETTVAVYQMLKAIQHQHETVGIAHIYAGKINASPNLRVRQEPSTESAVLGRLNNGAIIHIFAENDLWFQIRYNDQQAFISKDFVTILTTIENETIVEKPKAPEENQEKVNETVIENQDEEKKEHSEEENNQSEDVDHQENDLEEDITNLKQVQYLKGEVTASKLNVRKHASTTAEKLGELTVGTVVNVLKAEGDWYQILFNGKSAYIHSDFVTLLESPVKNVLRNRTIIIDPGHGGKDPGAVVNDLLEKDIVLKVSLLVKELLEAEGVHVLMTRADDTFLTLEERSLMANSYLETDLFLSVHANSATNSSANGAETFWNGNYASEQSSLFARKLQDQLISHMELVNRGVKHGNFRVIKATKAPSVLVELGFMSNEKDSKYMKTEKFYDDAVDGLFHGIVDYFLSLEEISEEE